MFWEIIKKYHKQLLFLLIVLVAISFRVYGINWNKEK